MQTYRNQYTAGTYDRIANCQRVLSEANPNFEYYDNFKDMDSPVDIRCKACGHVFTRSLITLRHRNKVHECPNCKAEAKRKQNEQLKADREVENIKARTDRKANRRLAMKAVQISMKRCPVCGDVFLDGRTYCSDRCRNQNKWNMKDGYRHQFPLPEVYERAEGICYICGGLCDWNDKIVRNGVIIYGDYYPSRDHVYPKSKGGANAWDNIKLAHRICNSRKSDSPLVENEICNA